MIGTCMLVIPPIGDLRPQPRSFRLQVPWSFVVPLSSLLRMNRGFGWCLVVVLFHLVSNSGSNCTPRPHLHGYIYIYLYIDILLFFALFEYKNSVIVALIAGRLKHSLYLEDKKEDYGDFLKNCSIRWIVHAVQRKKEKKMSKKSFKDRSKNHTQVEGVLDCVFWGSGRQRMSSPHAAGEPIKIPLRDQRSFSQSLMDRRVLGFFWRGEGFLRKRFEAHQSCHFLSSFLLFFSISHITKQEK